MPFDLGPIEDSLVGGDGTRPISPARMLALVRRMRAILTAADARADAIETRLTTGEAAITAHDGRLTTLEAVTPVTITVVATLGALPANASVRQWFRVAGDASVYVGNGPGNPLTKLIPQ